MDTPDNSTENEKTGQMQPENGSPEEIPAEDIRPADADTPDGSRTETDGTIPADGLTNQEEPEEKQEKRASTRRTKAWTRMTGALCVTVLLLCLTGFGAFKMMFGGQKLSADNVSGGKYLTFNVDTILDYLAEDYKSGGEATATDATATDATATDAQDTGTVTGRYAIVPADGKLVIVHFPQRYLESANTIAMQTYYQLYGMTTADKYFVASGTVKKAPAEIQSKYADWYNSNAMYMYQYGFINSLDQSAETYYVDVDSTGLFSDTWCIILSAVAGASFIYAALVFVLIKCRKYDDDITVEIIEEPAADEVSPEPEDENGDIDIFAETPDEPAAEDRPQAPEDNAGADVEPEDKNDA